MNVFVSVPASKVAAEIEREPGSWTAIYCDAGREEDTALAVLEAVEDAQAVGEGGSARVVVADAGLPNVVAEAPPESAVIVIGLQRLEPRELAFLDLQRNRMIDGPSMVLVIPQVSVPAIRQRMPNTWSLIGPRGWRIDAPEPTLNVDERLAGLRETYGRTDADVIEQAACGELPLDPPFIEWLVLIGRGDLLDD